MRIANNIMAMNTHRFYTGNNNAVSKSAEKLSSGFRINRAGDDAAGLAISEKMRAQIRGLSMAKKNSQDAVSMVQTAEGALQSVHSMLQRMNQLAVQSATGTNDLKAEGGVDRDALQQEFKNLMDEIDQVAETTTFNNMRILAGKYGSANAVAAPTTFVSTKVPGLEGGTNTPATKGTATMTGTVKTTLVTNAGGATTVTTATTTITADTLKNALEEIGASADKTGKAFTATANGTNIDIKYDGETIASVDTGKLNSNAGLNAGAGQEIDFGTAGKITVGGTAGTNVTAADVAKVLNDAISGVTADFKKAAAADGAGAAKTEFEEDTANKKAGEAAGEITLKGTTYADSTANLDTGDAAEIKGATIKIGGTGGEAVDLSGLTLTDGASTVDDAIAAIKTAVEAKAKELNDAGAAGTADYKKYDNVQVSFDAAHKKISVTYDETPMKVKEADKNDPAAGGAGLKIQTGAEEGQMLEIKINAMSTVGLGLALGKTYIDSGKTERQADGKGEYNIGTQAGAAAAITATRNAINAVSTQRAELGAMQNRLEYKIDNLANTAENLSAAESRIRDVDIAEEMTQFTKNNILSQAATAMLAQANSLPQNVLSLLR